MPGGDGVSVSQEEQSYRDARWRLRNNVDAPLNLTLKNKMIHFVVCIPFFFFVYF